MFIGSGSCIPSREIKNQSFLDNRFFRDYGEPIDPTDNPAVVEIMSFFAGLD